MSAAKPDGGPAFPLPMGAESVPTCVAGMTLRDYFAAESLPAIYTKAVSGHHPIGFARIAQLSYELADAMLEARK